MADGTLFSAIIARGPAAEAVSEAAWLEALLATEAGLAGAAADVGLIGREVAAEVVAACDPARFDAAELGRAAAATGNPVVPLVASLRSSLPRPAADAVHLGATSQDILDTATMLVARRAVDALVDDLAGAADAAASLALRYRSSPIAGRTLLRHATPTTFGAKAAGWLAGLDAATDGLARVRADRLAVQLGGASGTLSGLGTEGPRVVAALAARLGLGEPLAPWHTERTRIADLAGALGTASAAIAKPALDIILLGQTEVGEVGDDRPELGGSSAMPHKQNPVAAIAARACAAQAPGLVATLLAAAGAAEHERGAGAWHAEWMPLAALLRSVGSGASWLRDALEHLDVDEERMRTNAVITGGASAAERIAAALTPTIGRQAASNLVRAAALEAARDGRAFATLLGEREAVREALDPDELATLLDPAADLGAAERFVDIVLDTHAARTGPRAPGEAP